MSLGRAIVGAEDVNAFDGFREVWGLGYRTEPLDICILGFPDCHVPEELESE